MFTLRGITKYQKLVLLLAWLGWVFDIMDTALFNFAKGPMFDQMLGPNFDKSARAAIEGNTQAWFFLGWAVGGLLFGILADKWGRTRTLILTILLYSGCTALTAFCKTPDQVVVARFLTALGIGGEWAAGAALVAEAFRHSGRAPAAFILQSAAAFGPALAALANIVVVGRATGPILGFQPWQFLFLVGVLPALMCAVFRMGVHEPESAVKAKRSLSPLVELFSNPRWRRNALLAMVIGAVGIAGAGTAVYWAPNLVDAASVGMAKTNIAARKTYITWISHIGTLAGVLVVPMLCERFGRKRTIALFFVLSPLMVLVALSGGASYERLLLLLPLVNFFAIGVSAAFVLYFPELFPTQIRATGAGLAYNVGRLLSIPMPAITGAVVASTNGNIATAVVLSGGVYVLGLIAIPFAIETRGQPLPEDEPIPAV